MSKYEIRIKIMKKRQKKIIFYLNLHNIFFKTFFFAAINFQLFYGDHDFTLMYYAKCSENAK